MRGESRNDSRAPKDGHKEVGVLGERPQIPGGKQQLGEESAIGRIGEKLAELIISARPETNHRSAVGREVGT
jgi:hypothetical protein